MSLEWKVFLSLIVLRFVKYHESLHNHWGSQLEGLAAFLLLYSTCISGDVEGSFSEVYSVMNFKFLSIHVSKVTQLQGLIIRDYIIFIYTCLMKDFLKKTSTV